MAAFDGKEVTLGGWARSVRDSKAFGFIDLYDGSCFKTVQVVFEREKIANYDEIAKAKKQNRKSKSAEISASYLHMINKRDLDEKLF